MCSNLSGGKKEETDALANHIRTQLTQSGVCTVPGEALAVLWKDSPALSDMDKRLLVQNFSQQYGFLPVIDYGLECAIFREAG